MNRIILSRKGFDSKFGGKPSPIFRDKRIFSIPIPQEEPAPHRYKDVEYNNLSAVEALNEVSIKDIRAEDFCHFDPNLSGKIGVFGQASSSQTELKNANVDIGDLFLFFGWFKNHTKRGPNLHHIFGWLQISKIIEEVTKHIPGKNLGIHAHNDTENAVANSLVAVQAGVRQVQGTINGLGERCGNANLMSLIPTFFLKKDFSDKYEINIKPENIKNLTQCSRLLDEILNRKPNKHLPYVGASAFSHKGGMHVSAVQKDPKTYEHISPDEVGNARNIVVSDQSGQSNIMSRLNAIGISIKKDDPKIKKLLHEVKDREFIGYSYDGADASFELLARRLMGEIPRYISINEYDVSVKKDSTGEVISFAKAKLEVDGHEILCEGEGNGPVNALDNAIRKNVNKLEKYSEYLKDLKLVDYKVRILNTGTGAVTRVSIESADSKHGNWFTIGVSPNIIDASFKALVDSLDYKLFKDNAPAST